MKKTYPLAVDGKNPDRILDAVKHDIRKYQRRERRRPLPEGVDFLDFDCRFGRSAEAAGVVPLDSLIGLVDAAARDGAASVYVELLAKPGHRKPRPAAADSGAEANTDNNSDEDTDANADPAPDADSGFPPTELAPQDSGFPPTQFSPQDSDDQK